MLLLSLECLFSSTADQCDNTCACPKTTLILYCTVMMDLNVSLSFNQVKQRHPVPLSSQSSSPPALSHNTAGQHSTAQHSTAQETDTSSASIFRCLTCVNKSSPRRKHSSSQEEADGSEQRPNSDGLSEKGRQADEVSEFHVCRFRRIFQQNRHVASGGG